MLTVFRIGASRTLGLLRNVGQVTQVATLTGRTTRGGPLQLKKPFPYQKKKITYLEAVMDITVKRIEEENAKIIVIEGPVAAGKTAVAKILAEEFDMLYLDPPSMDDILITRTGFDMRTFDDQLPESVRSYDNKNFCLDPTNIKANSFQLLMLRLRFSQYLDAIAHILNTGQGVILERSVYSDYAFAEAMYSEGYMSERVRNYYIKVRDIAAPLILKPHVIIYLDVPITKVQERIKTRNLSYEVNSPVFTPNYLQKMEDTWKFDYLKMASNHSDILVYDWSEGGDTDLIIEDLEKLDLDPLKQDHYGKFYDWKLWRSRWRQLRMEYTNEKGTLQMYLQTPVLDVPEIMVPTDEMDQRNALYDSAPGNEYINGYNPEAGDSLLSIILGRTPSHRSLGSIVIG